MTADAVPAGATVKPRLSVGQRATAALAGILGYLLIGIGWALVASALALGAVVNLLTTSARNQAIDEGDRALARQVANGLDVGFAPLVVAGIVGAVLVVLGLFVSRGILRRGGHFRPWAITWAGLGIAVLISIVVNAIGGAILGAVTQVQIGEASRSISRGDQTTLPDALAPFGTTAAVSGIVALVLLVVIGWIAWSWMATALRPTVEKIAARDERARTRLEHDRSRLDAASERHARERAEHEERAAAERAEAERAEGERTSAERDRLAAASSATPATPAGASDSASGGASAGETLGGDHAGPAHRAPGAPDEGRP